MKKTTTCISGLLMLCLVGTLQAQHISIFPELPFDLKAAVEKGYSKVSVFVNQNQKGEEDESGYQWSIPYGDGYQMARYSFFDGKMEMETRYLPNGDKEVAWQYNFIGDLLSVIDELHFDSLQEPKHNYSYVFHYDAQGNPFQKVVEFKNERLFRLLYDYSFDKERRPIREKISSTGQITKWDNIKGLVPGRQEQITLVEHRSDAKILRIYENMHRNIETHRTIYDLTTRMPQRTEYEDVSHKVQYVVDYDYEESRLTRETRYRPTDDGSEPKKEAVTYYFYDADGLLERKMVEVDNLQTIYSYSYFNE